MMRMMTKTTELTSMNKDELEVRPGGMLVQKRDPDDAHNRIPPPTIRVRVKYGSIYHEIIISSTATFGELKKMLTGPTGLHHEDQKLIYRDKERASKTFLDVVGVKDKSKMVLLEDSISREKRHIEARKNAKMAKSAKSISDIGLEVDRLAAQVTAIESVISKGGKVTDKMMSDLTELLMNHLLKLDEINVDGDVNQQKKMQMKKVQRYVETLDVLKIKNDKNHAPPELNNSAAAKHHRHQTTPSVGRSSALSVVTMQEEASSKKTSGGVVVTTQWETFDSSPSTSTAGEHIFNWDLL